MRHSRDCVEYEYEKQPSKLVVLERAKLVSLDEIAMVSSCWHARIENDAE